MIAQIFNPTAELAIPTGPPTNAESAKIRTYPLTAKTKTRNLYTLFYSIFIYFFSLKSRLTFSFATFVFKVLIFF